MHDLYLVVMLLICVLLCFAILELCCKVFCANSSRPIEVLRLVGLRGILDISQESINNPLEFVMATLSHFVYLELFGSSPPSLLCDSSLFSQCVCNHNVLRLSNPLVVLNFIIFICYCHCCTLIFTVDIFFHFFSGSSLQFQRPIYLNPRVL